MNGLLCRVFQRVGCKRLTGVEINPEKSHQHEFGGAALRSVLGIPEGKVVMPAVFVWLGGPQEAIIDEGKVTWYDTRANKPNRSPEYRLYFEKSDVINLASEGDMLFAARKRDGELYLVVTPAESSAERQLLLLFGLQDTDEHRAREIADEPSEVTDFILQIFLDQLGLRTFDDAPNLVEAMRDKFGDRFPGPRTFSDFARSTARGVDQLSADGSLMRWVSHEDNIYRQFETYIIDHHFDAGNADETGAAVDTFLKLIQTVQVRRSLRAGWALENHLQYLLESAGVHFSRGVRTDGGQGLQDFLFPGAEEVRLPAFPLSYLTRLCVMPACGGRWRQVLAGRNRIPVNHLLTLEPGIGESETAAMEQASIKLVIPQVLHSSYSDAQRKNILSVSEFVALVSERQEKSNKNPGP